MVRTGARAAALRKTLLVAGLKTSPPPGRPLLSALLDAHSDEVLSLYRRLGGTEDAPSLRPGAWDLSFNGSLVVELGEELHFNRYRAMTLGASWSADRPWTSDYLTFCEAHEDECTSARSWGKRWSNPSCERIRPA